MASSAPPTLIHASNRVTGDAGRTRALIDAAYELLDEGGLEGLTIRAVLAKAGLARRAFYERFNGKDDLVLAVFDESLRSAAVHFRKMTVDCMTPLEALQIIVNGIVLGQLGYSAESGNLRSAALSREHMRLAEARPEELQSALRPLLDLISGLVEQGIAEGTLRRSDPALQARMIYNLVSTTVHTLLLSEEGVDPDRTRREDMATALWEFCRRAIVA